MPRSRVRVPAPLRVVLRALGLSFVEVANYWREERLALRRGLTAVLLTSLTGTVAGLVLVGADHILEQIPGLLLLVPAAIDMRGNIYGALASRLSTALHLGEYSATLRRDAFMGRQIEATTLLTISTSVVIAVMAWAMGTAFGLEPIPVWSMVVIAAVGGVISSLFLLMITVALSRVAQRRDWNMDDVGVPSVTVIGDVLTIPALLLATLLVGHDIVALVLGLLLAGAGIWALVAGWMHRDPIVRRIVRESTITLAVAAAVGAIAGTLLEIRLAQWVAVPVLLVMIPPFVANCGSLGGILSSRLASKLHLGLIESRLVPGRLAALDVSVVFVFALFAFAAIGTVAWVAATVFGLAPPGWGTVVAVSLLAGLLATVILSAVAYTTAVTSVRFGLDPDNEGIPIVTSTMDLLGLISFLAVVGLIGVS